MHYYQHHIGDFIKDTHFLKNEEVGIYMKLIWLYYDTEKPFPNDLPALSVKASTTPKKVELILKLFFRFEDDQWHHTRCDEEIAEYRAFLLKQKANGLKGGRPKSSQTEPKQNPPLTQTKPKITLTDNHKPLTNNHNKNISPPDGVPVNVWNDFLKVRKAKKSPVTQTALNGIQREAQKAGKSLAEAIQICCERGWAGFKADWLKTTPEKEDKMKNFWLQIEGQ